jgi:hypothetical protein
MKNNLFYTKLENQKEPINELLSKTNLFQRIPDKWYIVITDIEGSSVSVEKGLSQLVNLIATGSIIAALNIAKKYSIDIPFFFGGDGATMIIPPILLQETMEALILHKENIQEEFDIHLRVGNVPVTDVYKNDQELKIIKASINKLHTIPVVLGNGLHFAEKLIKSRDIVIDKSTSQQTNLDLDGMECRWNKISPPENLKEVVTLLISTVSESKQASLFKSILEKTDKIYGSLNSRNPISVPKLKLNFSYQKIKTELKARTSKFVIISFLKIWLTGLIGKYYYLPNVKGRKYLNELTQLSDILVINGRINMIISGTAKQRQLLTEYLDGLEKNELIIYGIHISEKSIMSCYVRNRKEKHIHFVDGGSSGYTRAAMILKEKMKNYKNEN